MKEKYIPNELPLPETLYADELSKLYKFLFPIANNSYGGHIYRSSNGRFQVDMYNGGGRYIFYTAVEVLDFILKN